MAEPKTPPNHYVNNAEFLAALLDYKAQVQKAKDAGLDIPPISNYIGDCFIKIATHLSYKSNFINYSFKDDMISDGIENCLTAVAKFDPSKSSNPFAYYTQIIYFAFIRRIQKEKKQLYIKYKSTEHIGVLDEGMLFETADGQTKQFEMYDNISEFIENYEDSRAAKKAEKEAKKKPEGVERFL